LFYIAISGENHDSRLKSVEVVGHSNSSVIFIIADPTKDYRRLRFCNDNVLFAGAPGCFLQAYCVHLL
jgi:hypothetical protein